MGFNDATQIAPPDNVGGDSGIPDVTSLDVAISFVTEFNENTAIFATVLGMLSSYQSQLMSMMGAIPMDPFGNPLITGDLTPSVDPETGLSLEGPVQGPVDVVGMQFRQTHPICCQHHLSIWGYH